MKKLNIASRFFIAFCAVNLLSVSIMAFINPQSVMDLVQVKLNNTDAYSSIRGVYGGVGLTIFVVLIYLLIKDIQKGLVFLILLWGFYAISRTITIMADGPLGSFGNTWIVIEYLLCIASVTLLILRQQLLRIK